MPRTQSSSRAQTSNDYQNLLLSSEVFNTTWTKTGSPTVVDNFDIAPDGNQTAAKMTGTSASGLLQSVLFPPSTLHTFSFYIKNIDAVTSRYLERLDVNNNIFDVTVIWSGSVLSSLSNSALGPGASTGFEDAGNGWYRVYGTGRAILGGATPDIIGNSGTGTKNVLIWGAQLTIGRSMGVYKKTTTSAYNPGNFRSNASRRIKANRHFNYSLKIPNTPSSGLNVPNTAALQIGTKSFAYAVWCRCEGDALTATKSFGGYSTNLLGWMLQYNVWAYNGYCQTAGAAVSIVSMFRSNFSGDRNAGVNKWHRYVFTMDVSDLKGRLYFDGKLVATGSVQPAWNITTVTNAWVGRNANFAGPTPSALYNDACFMVGGVPSLTDVENDYYDGITMPYIVHRYAMDEGTGTTCVDSVAGNTASFGGSPTWVTESAFKSRTLA